MGRSWILEWVLAPLLMTCWYPFRSHTHQAKLFNNRNHIQRFDAFQNFRTPCVQIVFGPCSVQLFDSLCLICLFGKKILDECWDPAYTIRRRCLVILWQCVSNVSVMLWRCGGDVVAMRWRWFRHVLGMSQQYFWFYRGMVWTWFGHVLFCFLIPEPLCLISFLSA